MADILEQFFKSKNYCKKKLVGGRSNLSYVVEFNDTLYKFRIPIENSLSLVSRRDEIRNLRELLKTQYIENIYYENEDGTLLVDYIKGTAMTDVTNIDIDKIVNCIKYFQNQNVSFNNTFSVYDNIEKFEKLSNNSKSEKYKQIKNYCLNFKNEIISNLNTPSHNDSELCNMIMTNNKIVLIDFELTGYNHYLYDIACLDANDYNLMLKVFSKYKEYTQSEYILLHIIRILQCLQWYNIASIKYNLGYNEKLNLDFKAIADDYLNNANRLYEIIKKDS